VIDIQTHSTPRISDGDEDDTVTTKPDTAEALTVDKLETWLNEIRNQPHWRPTADMECEYYDGNQLAPDVIEELESRGQAPIIDNLIMPTINAILGMQAKSRMDTKVVAETGETNTDVADALSVMMKHYGTESRSDRAKSDVYAEGIKAGVSWFEVSRNSNPFECPIRYDHVHRREIYWDWRSRKQDLSDARYLIRRKWMDKDVLLAVMPDQKPFIDYALGGIQPWDMASQQQQVRMGRGHEYDFGAGFGVSIEQYEWMNVERQRLVVYEVWYRVIVNGMVAKMPNGKIVEIDENDPLQQMALHTGAINPRPATFDKIRCAIYLGPRLIGDYPSPYKHRHFPYVPFFCFREDNTGIPYGLIRPMISPQDEINARKSKMYWLLSAKRVTATDGAVADHAVAAREIARPDAYVIVSNKPNERFEVQENGPMAQQQFQVMQEAKESIQANVGVHNATLGRDSGATSGLAINSLVEQDSITLAEANDNFNMACRHADELMLSNIIVELSDKPNHPVTVEDPASGGDKVVMLNQLQVDPQTGQPTIINDITNINAKVVLSDTPSTPTFRNQQLSQMSEVMKALPPNVQAMLLPMYLLATDLPQRQQMADVIRKGLGLGDDNGQDPQVQQLQQQLQQAMDKIQELQQKLLAKFPPEIIAAQVAKMLAEADNIKAGTVETNVKALYEAMQSAEAVAVNPAIVPIADSLAKSAGFVDSTGGDMGQEVGNGQMPQGVQPNPTLPPSPQMPSGGQPPAMTDGQQLQSPAQGVAGGIEQQGNQVGQ